jgi:ATP synthase protein I
MSVSPWPRLFPLDVTRMDEDLKKTIKELGSVSTVGMTMAFSIALGALIGYYLDKWLGTKPWLFFVFLGFGIAAAFRNLYILYKKAKDL